MSTNELALGPLIGGTETAVYDSSDDEIEPDGCETDISSIADEPKPDPIKLRIERGLEKLTRPRRKDGTTRVEWTCRCGVKLYNDFSNSDQEGIEDLRLKLGKTLPIKFHDRRRPSSLQSWIRSVWVGVKNISIFIAPFTTATINRPAQRSGVIAVDISSIQSDGALFRELKAAYSGLRRQRAPSLWSTFVKPVSVKFVSFQLSSLEHHQYSYVPGSSTCMLATSLHTLPPVKEISTESSVFLHYLNHPAHTPFHLQLCVNKIPKRQRDQDDNLSVANCWGIRIVEGPDFAHLLILASLGSLVIPVIGVILMGRNLAEGLTVLSCLLLASTVIIAAWAQAIRGELSDLVAWFKAKNPPRTKNKIMVAGGEEHTISNKFKCRVEDTTGQKWDWWPFAPRLLPLQPDQARVKFQCPSGCTHWLDIPKISLPPSKRQRGDSFVLTNLTNDSSSDGGSNDDLSQAASFCRDFSPTTSVGTSSTTAQDSMKRRETPSSGNQQPPPTNPGHGVNIVPPSQMEGFVLFSADGAPYLQSSRLRLTQIDTKEFSHDDNFFDEMFFQCRKLRGYLRWYLSPWVFAHCIFSKFYKMSPTEIYRGPEELPPVQNGDYHFARGPEPPFSDAMFKTRFYGCLSATCWKAQIRVLCFIHQCQGRTNSGYCDVLKCLPKRKQAWGVAHSDDTSEAWGLHANTDLSFFRTVIYHVVILSGPAGFWGWWLHQWPTDWQNASVPMLVSLALLSPFWLAVSEGEKAKREREASWKKNV